MARSGKDEINSSDVDVGRKDHGEGESCEMDRFEQWSMNFKESGMINLWSKCLLKLFPGTPCGRQIVFYSR